METVKRIRTMRGMNQVDLAKASGVSQNTISEIETGRREARPATLGKLARALDVDIADFFDEPSYPKKAPRGLSPEPSPFNGVEGWLAAHGHRDKDQFRDDLLDLDLDIDEEGRPRGLEEAIAELRHTRDRLLEDLKRPATRTTLFPRRSGLPTKEERIREALRPAKEAWELEWEIRHEYLAREVALINHGRGLLEGADVDELLEAAYAQASAA